MPRGISAEEPGGYSPDLRLAIELTRHAQAIVALRRAKELEAGARASQRADAAGRLIAENAAAV